MSKQTIEVDGLPEGWNAVAYRVPKGNIEFVFIENVVREAKPQDKKCLIIEKIQPRRIVLEETEEKCLGCQTLYIDDTEFMIMTAKVWREVKETNDEPKLSLSVDEAKEIYTYNILINQKIIKFIKENS